MGKFHDKFNPFGCLDSSMLIAISDDYRSKYVEISIFEFTPNNYVLVEYSAEDERDNHEAYSVRYWRGNIKYVYGIIRSMIGTSKLEQEISIQLKNKGLI